MISILDYLKTLDRKEDQAIVGIDNMVNEFIPALNEQTTDLETFITNKVRVELNSAPEFPLDVIINPKYKWQKFGLNGHYAITNCRNTWHNLIEVNGKGLFLGAYNHTWLNYNESGTSGTIYYKIVVDGVDFDSVSFNRNSYDQMTGWGNVVDGKISLPQVWPTGTSTANNQRMPTGSSNTGISGQAYITNIGDFVPFTRSFVVKATYNGTPSSSDAIYNFDAAIKLVN